MFGRTHDLFWQSPKVLARHRCHLQALAWINTILLQLSHKRYRAGKMNSFTNQARKSIELFFIGSAQPLGWSTYDKKQFCRRGVRRPGPVDSSATEYDVIVSAPSQGLCTSDNAAFYRLPGTGLLCCCRCLYKRLVLWAEIVVKSSTRPRLKK